MENESSQKTQHPASSNPRCINIDWLEVYALEDIPSWPMDADYFRRQGWQVEEREYGTRTFQQMFTLYDQQGLPFLEVRRAPVGMFKNGERNYSYEEYGCHLRLVNRYCYADNAAALVIEFMRRYNYMFSRIAKIDLALDFELFDFGDVPSKFVKRYIGGKYAKINQSQLAAHGKDDWSTREWSSISWGADRSPILTRFYNKTKELREVKDKPYIRQAWTICGLIDNPLTMTKTDENGERQPEIWRLEFSIRSTVKRWVQFKKTDEQGHKKWQSLRNTLDIYTTRPDILKMFSSLVAHYFHFRKYEEGKSKYKCDEKRLFDFGDNQRYYNVEKPATDRQPDSTIKRLIKLLNIFMVTHWDKDAKQLARELITDLEQIQLKEMATNYWDATEVELLRQLFARRQNHPQEPMELSREMARQFVELEQSIWKDIDNLNDYENE